MKKKKKRACFHCGSIKKPIKKGTPCGESFTHCPSCKITLTASWLGSQHSDWRER